MVKDISNATWWEAFRLIFVTKKTEVTKGLDNSYYRCVTKQLGDTKFIIELGF